MKSTVETLSPTRVKLAIEVPFEELKPSLQKAYREIGAQVQVPGFRRGKIPAAVIDQRVGRGAVLNEAVQEAIPEQILAAVREHDVKTLGRPEVEITEFADNEPLKFTAEVDVRPEITIPDLSTISVTVPAVEVGDDEIDEQINGLRERFATLKTVDRPAEEGDYVQLDLRATVDGEEVAGGSATNISHEVGSKQLLPGLDEVLVGLVAGADATFTTQLVGGDFAGRDAEVEVTVRTRQGQAAARASTTSSPSWRASSTPSRSSRTTCASGSPRSRRSSRSTRPGTRRSSSSSRRPTSRLPRASSRTRSRAASRR